MHAALMAERYPNSKFVGIDLSEKAIGQAKMRRLLHWSEYSQKVDILERNRTEKQCRIWNSELWMQENWIQRGPIRSISFWSSIHATIRWDPIWYSFENSQQNSLNLVSKRNPSSSQARMPICDAGSQGNEQHLQRQTASRRSRLPLLFL